MQQSQQSQGSDVVYDYPGVTYPNPPDSDERVQDIQGEVGRQNRRKTKNKKADWF
jgi:hypothetical protein